MLELTPEQVQIIQNLTLIQETKNATQSAIAEHQARADKADRFLQVKQEIELQRFLKNQQETQS